MSDFRKSKDILGVSVVRKGSKYDKLSKGHQRDHDGDESFGDLILSGEVKAAAKLAKEKKSDVGDTIKTYSKYTNMGPSKGRKDFPFFKHTTKGK